MVNLMGTMPKLRSFQIFKPEAVDTKLESMALPKQRQHPTTLQLRARRLFIYHQVDGSTKQCRR